MSPTSDKSEIALPAESTFSGPLCVDLDGTLILTNSLLEAVLALVRTQPWNLWKVVWWMLKGQAALWEQLAGRIDLKIALLPFRQELLAWLVAQHNQGRTLILVTGAHRRVALNVAAHLGLFSETIATADGRHITGRAKLTELVRRFGCGGYDYVGGDTADLIPASGAKTFFAVGKIAAHKQRLPSGSQIVPEEPHRAAVFPLFGLLRPYQWAKNTLALAPVLLSHRWMDVHAWKAAAIAFAAFCCASSAGYILNDLLDIEADRKHPNKRHRPLAAGSAGILPALGTGAALGVVGLLLVTQLRAAAALGVAVYFCVSICYSFWLKMLPLTDVIVLTGLYTSRIQVGGLATGIPISAWTFGFAMFLFFGLAMAKRYSELVKLIADPELKSGRRGYLPADMLVLMCLGTGTGVVSILVIALYLTSRDVIAMYRNPAFLAAICPVLLWWLSRVWLLAGRGELNDDPVLFAVTDPQSWLGGALCMAAFLMAL